MHEVHIMYISCLTESMLLMTPVNSLFVSGCTNSCVHLCESVRSKGPV